MKNGLGYNIKAMAGVIILEIYDEMYYWEGWSNYLRWQIAEFGEDAPIVIRVDSIGGDPRPAMAMYSIIKGHKGKSTCYIEYMCDSSATLVACACDEVIGNEFPFEYMIHEPKIDPGWVTADQAAHDSEVVRSWLDDFARIYVEKTGQSESDIRKWMKAEKFMKAEEALYLGFIDKIEKVNTTLAAKVDYKLAAKAYERPPEFKIEGRGKSPDPEQPKNKPIKAMEEFFKKVKAAFGLGDSSDDADVVIHAKELKAKAERLETENQGLKTANQKLQAKLDELKEEEPTSEELEEQEAQDIDAELEAAVKGFKIKASQKEAIAGKYKGNLDGLKAALEIIPEGAAKEGGSPTPRVKARAGNGISDTVSKHFN